MLLKNAIVVTICGLVSLPAFGQKNPMSQVDVSIGTSALLVRNYSLPGGYPLFFDQCCIARSNSYEMFPAKRWSPVVLADALVPDPNFVSRINVTTQRWDPYGVSKFNLEDRGFARAEHRKIFYRSTALNSFGANRLDRFTNRDEPAIVFGYTFKR